MRPHACPVCQSHIAPYCTHQASVQSHLHLAALAGHFFNQPLYTGARRRLALRVRPRGGLASPTAHFTFYTSFASRHFACLVTDKHAESAETQGPLSTGTAHISTEALRIQHTLRQLNQQRASWRRTWILMTMEMKTRSQSGRLNLNPRLTVP